LVDHIIVSCIGFVKFDGPELEHLFVIYIIFSVGRVGHTYFIILYRFIYLLLYSPFISNLLFEFLYIYIYYIGERERLLILLETLRAPTNTIRENIRKSALRHPQVIFYIYLY
jgi:hypothetical protein